MGKHIRTAIFAALLAFPVFASAQSGQSPARISPTDAPPETPDGAIACPNDGALLLNQPPNQTNGIFADADCALCATGQQTLAENFVLAAPSEIAQLVFWGGYFPTNQIPAAPEPLTVIIHQDAGGVPGAAIDSQFLVPASATVTGVNLFGVSEINHVVDINPVSLPAGTFWVELFVNSAGNPDSFFWEVGNLDGASGSAGLGAAFETPGVNWFTDPSTNLSLGLCGRGENQTALARFLVFKDFDDNNEAEVEVTLSCNTGLPLEQTTMISEGDPVTFVIGDFEPGSLNCEVTEIVPSGYTASYNDGTVSPDSCSWEGLDIATNACGITNSLNQVEIEVTKVWIDENPQFNAQNVADAAWSCSNVAFGQNNGFLQFFGNPGEDSFFVFPDWEFGTTCSIVEVGLNESGVEVDDSECDGLVVVPGEGASCTIFNTRLFEGIPTLSQYGLAVLALLMLGVGFVAFRRLI